MISLKAAAVIGAELATIGAIVVASGIIVNKIRTRIDEQVKSVR